MSIKFIDELTPGKTYAVIDREKDKFTVDPLSDDITVSVPDRLLYMGEKTTVSPYIRTQIPKTRFTFQDLNGESVSLTKTHDLLFIQS
ncbi:MAG: hypothetical protein CMC93_05370 [Flavobacteriaceae bacterium]|nr:hypothetical protein [Flavobacteriaceae bacterium]